jgi:hypothetical protein
VFDAKRWLRPAGRLHGQQGSGVGRSRCPQDGVGVARIDDLLPLVLHQQFVVDAGLAEFVLDHGDALAMLFAQDAVEQRRLAAAKKAGEDGDGKS